MELIEKEKCFTCGACVAICPKGAITTKEFNGFKYPNVNNEKCINCGLCNMVCPANKVIPTNASIPLLYAFQHSDDKISLKSSSGGAFTALSDLILSEGGVVAGAVLDGKGNIGHAVAEDKEGRDAMRAAKYAQSDIGLVYLRLEKYVREGRSVLFTGTPCQTDAFRCYCNTKKLNTEKVIFCSLVCHGVASNVIWRDFFYKLKKQQPGRKININFRNKTNGWRKNKFTAEIDGRTVFLQTYSRLYFSNLCNKKSCFTCPYTTPLRNSDITIGDFWSIDKFDTEIQERNGISMLLSHSEKGDSLIKKCSQFGLLKQYQFLPERDFLQIALQKHFTKPLEYNQFWSDYYKYGFDYVEKKYTSRAFIDRVKRKIRRFILSVRK